jgi:hypothetical protein
MRFRAYVCPKCFCQMVKQYASFSIRLEHSNAVVDLCNVSSFFLTLQAHFDFIHQRLTQQDRGPIRALQIQGRDQTTNLANPGPE